ncbi:FG-GAP-like repeat-containing protein [Micromonospora chaiyaphumensis]|uniref:Repeat domain-containing protein n=1 Tax=Micromonospora chaiyaphumensis TaxID=307119 RepID=A0A1C4ZJ55_9ACTN|nr:FG-GAP-like repeat-containing protein [Micromonospora chaiyaphumensis]SCF32876.1 Repeat domain-containing protein [Micromonospora chaiyaphumensis]
MPTTRPPRRTRATSFATAASLLVTAAAMWPGAVATADPDGYAGAPRPAPTADTSLDVEQALAQARRTGQPVEATATGTSTSVVTALPDGQVHLTQHATATRKKVDGSWKPLDATLVRRPDGTITSSVTTNDVALSPGGEAPLAQLTSGDRTFTVDAPMPLPAPTLSGATATYAGVLPDVDLVVTVNRNGGFSHVFVVRTPEAADNPELLTLSLGTHAQGFSLSVDKAGNIAGRDRSGATALSAPAPLMWDSSSSPAAGPAARSGQTSDATAPGRAARTAPVKVRMQGRKLHLVPDRTLLSGTKTVYPVFIDPTFNWSPAGSGRGGWASISYQHQSTNYWMTTPDPIGRMQVGNAGEQRSNTLINFSVPVSTLTGAEINSAIFKITNTRSWNCDPKQVNVYAPNTVLSGTNATWNYWEGQSSGPLAASKSFAYGYSGCAADGVSFDITGQIQRDVSDNHKTRTLWMKAYNEAGDPESWKEFLETSPTLEIQYNHKPNKPTGLTTSPKTTCAGGSTVGDASVSLYAPVSDRNGGVLGVSFRLTRKSDGAVVATSDPNKLTASSGTTAVLVVPQATLRQYAGYTGPGTGTVTAYTWKVQATDFRTPSDWSDTCTFSFDPTRPGHPDVTAPAESVIGQPASFTITAAGGTTPSGYLYQLNAAAPVQVTASGTGSTTVSILPTRYTNTLTVTSLSPGGNIGDSESVTFNSDPAVTAVDGDMTGDDIPDLLVAGNTNGLPPGLWLTEGGSDGPPAPATNIGSKGNGLGTVGSSKDFNGAQAITGQFAGYGLQDVLVYYPAGANAGGASMLRANGDGSVIQPYENGNQVTVPREALTDEADVSPLQVANAGDARHTGQPYPDLIGISGNETGYYLTYYPSTGPGSFQQVTRTSATTPDGGNDWNNWTIATTQTTNTTGTSTAMFLWKPGTGALHLWTGLSFDIDNGQLTYTSYTLSTAGWNKDAVLGLRAADINNDGTPDLWTVGASGTTKTWRVTNLTAGTGSITGDPEGRIVTAKHAWHFADAKDGQASTVPAEDAVGTLAATGSGAAAWRTGDLFDPSITLDGANSTLTTTGAAVATDAGFSISVWAKPNASGGTVVSQDGVNTAGFKLWADASDNSWRFAMSRSDVASPIWDTVSSGANTVRLGAWTQLAITFKPASGTLRNMYLYINGRNIASASHTTIWNADRSLRFGSTRTGASTTGGYFNGQLSTAQAWDSAVINPSPAPHDLNGDGKADIVTADSSGNLYLRPNTGGTGMSTFGTPMKIGQGWDGWRWDIHDWTQDGLADVMGVDASGQLWAYPNVNGAPTYATRKRVGVGWTDYTHASANANTSPQPDHFGIKNSTGELFYYPNGCCAVRVAQSGWSNYRIYPVDFNRDGLDDLISIDTTGNLYWYPNTGQAGLAMFGTRKQIGSGWATYRVAITDVNGDGLPDIVAGDSKGDGWVYPGSSDVSFPSRYQIASGWLVSLVKTIG